MTTKTKLGNIVSIMSGYSPSNYHLTYSGTSPFVKVDDLNNCDKILYHSRQYITSTESIIPAGAVIFPKRGAAILTNKVRIAGVSLQLDSNLMALIPNEEKINSEYLYYFILQQKLYKIADTSTIAQINNKHIIPYVIDLPTLDIQKKIAKILGTVDHCISIRKTQLRHLSILKKSLMQQLLTGKKRFPQFAGTKWKEYRIGAFAEQVTQKNQAGKELPVLSCTKYDGLVDSLQYFGRRVFSNNISTYKIVNRNEFAYATNHIEEGSIGLQQRYDSALISPMYTVFRINNPSLATNGFLHLVLKTETYRKIFEAMTNASVNRRGSLRWKEFSRIRINLPTIAEQNRIVEFGKLLDHELVILTTQLELLQALKRGLMEKLLTGKLPIPLSEEAANV